MVVVSTDSAAARTLTGQPVAPRATAVTLPALQAWRIRRAMMQYELAAASGVSLRTVTRLERGGRAGLDTARQLAKALGIEAADLMSVPPSE